MHRDAGQWRNLLLAELPNGDFADTLLRQAFFDQYHLLTLEALAHSSDKAIGDVAAKAVKEAAYHWRRSADLVVRLGDGTNESHARCEAALARVWPHVGEMFLDMPGDTLLAACGQAPLPSGLAAAFMQRIGEMLSRATLSHRPLAPATVAGREGRHTTHFEERLSEMQSLQRAYPGATW